jgi:type III secretory pathway component EscS
MSEPRRRFSLFAYFYGLLFVCLLFGAPLLGVAAIDKHQTIPATAWAVAGSLSFCLAASFAYANARCSGERLTYREGLLYVTSCVMAGSHYFSLIFVMPAILVTFLASVVISLYYDLTGSRQKAAPTFYRWVAIFSRHRLRQ